MKIKYLLEKEFKQFLRNSFLPKMVVFMPVLMLLVMPWAADMNIKYINLIIVDQDNTTFSRRLAEKASASEYFAVKGFSDSYDRAIEEVEYGRADVILEIPRHFERDLIRTGVGKVLISANTVNGTRGSFGSSYLEQIVAGFATDLNMERGAGRMALDRTPRVEVEPRIMYNPTMDYKKFMVPAFMVVLLTLIGGFLPALNVVMEKEAGTIEQINVTPVGKLTFIVAKLIPYWLMGSVVLTFSLVIGWIVYGIVPVGSLWTIYAAFLVYIVALSGFGIVISNYSATMQQAMFVMFFFMIIFILMSGIFTPVTSMPQWAQKLTLVNPLRYFITIMRSVFFKGSGFVNLRVEFIVLAGFAFLSNTWAVVSYRKSS